MGVFQPPTDKHTHTHIFIYACIWKIIFTSCAIATGGKENHAVNANLNKKKKENKLLDERFFFQVNFSMQ